ncbi:hypothetical protein LTR15_002914 [Elasticomyces elasticus]|nr:hypothetical protein LTR15_002914 [Elasticomyces elasticus]
MDVGPPAAPPADIATAPTPQQNRPNQPVSTRGVVQVRRELAHHDWKYQSINHANLDAVRKWKEDERALKRELKNLGD